MENIYGLPTVADADTLSIVPAWSRQLARVLAARDAAILDADDEIPQGDPDAYDSIALRLGLVEHATADTGWVDLTVTPGFVAHPGFPPQVRRIGHAVFYRGGVSDDGLSAPNTTYTPLWAPAGFRPDRAIYQLGASGNFSTSHLVISQTGGNIDIRTTDALGGYYLLDGLGFLLPNAQAGTDPAPLPVVPHDHDTLTNADDPTDYFSVVSSGALSHVVNDVQVLRISNQGELSIGSVPWARLTSVPTEFPPASHTHDRLDSDNLVGGLLIDAGGSLSHRVNGSEVTRINQDGTMVSGSVPVSQVPGLSDRLAALEYFSGRRFMGGEMREFTTLTAQIFLYRVRETVEFVMRDAPFDTKVPAAGQVIVTLPEGFRPVTSYRVNGPTFGFEVDVLPNGEVTMLSPGSLTTASGVDLHLVHATNEAPPSILPGTPA